MDELHAISLGAGVQSSTMALMAAHGELTPMPECAIFADTQAEPASVYRWLDYLETKLPFPVHRVTKGSLTEAALLVKLSVRGRYYTDTAIPAWVEDEKGNIGPMMRQCTSDFKIEVIQREIRRLRNGRQVVQWIGISTDEAHRAKPSMVAKRTVLIERMLNGDEVKTIVKTYKPHPYITNIWPVIDAGMNRRACLLWMESHGYPKPPRSACVYCPFHSDDEWKRLRDDEPDAFAQAVGFERNYRSAMERGRLMRTIPYLHRSMKPLDQVNFDTGDRFSGWGNECSGICGV